MLQLRPKMRWLFTATVLIGCTGLVLTRKVQHSKVLVLGAGAAGLSAAKALHDQGITDFIILEGSDRIGGRVKSVNFSGNTVEAGGNWVATTENFKLLSDFVAKYNVKGIATDYFNNKGIIVMNAVGEDVTKHSETAFIKFETAKENFLKKVKELIAYARPDMSVRSCLKIGGWRPKNYTDDLVEIFEIDANCGVMPEAVSCFQESTQDVVEDSFYVSDDRGYELLLKKYVEDAVHSGDPRIRLNEVVNKIEHNKNTVTVTAKSGKIFTSNFAIVTFSVGTMVSCRES